jgi:hypothetical protein
MDVLSAIRRFSDAVMRYARMVEKRGELRVSRDYSQYRTLKVLLIT